MSDDDREHPDPELVTVYETSDPDMVPIIKSILNGAEIPYSMEGESMVNLLPTEAMQPIMTDHKGELKFEVPKDRAEEAEALLSQDFQKFRRADQVDLDRADQDRQDEQADEDEG